MPNIDIDKIMQQVLDNPAFMEQVLKPESTDQDLMREQIRNDVLRFAITQLDPTKRDDVELLTNIYAATR